MAEEMQLRLTDSYNPAPPLIKPLYVELVMVGDYSLFQKYNYSEVRILRTQTEILQTSIFFNAIHLIGIDHQSFCGDGQHRKRCK